MAECCRSPEEGGRDKDVSGERGRGAARGKGRAGLTRVVGDHHHG